MPRYSYQILLAWAAWIITWPGSLVLAQAPASTELGASRRVAWLGSTLIEREQVHGYWELEITRRLPGKVPSFRNLGWSGDTVWADSRAGFGTAEDGFNLLREQVKLVQPDLIIYCYGANESFAKEPGLLPFDAGLSRLLDSTHEDTAARQLLMTSNAFEPGPLSADAAAQANAQYLLYQQLLQEQAKRRGLGLIDFFHLSQRAREQLETPLTENGIHLDALGYWQSAPALAAQLVPAPLAWQVTIRARTKVASFQGTEVTNVSSSNGEISWDSLDTVLPAALPPAGVWATRALNAGWKPDRVLKIDGLPRGEYQLLIDDAPVAMASHGTWADGVSISAGPEYDQTARLRNAILRKNELFFYRWRPQNETYLFGFRKHEQGNNAVEIPMFDPLVEEQEKQINSLSQPKPHHYTLKPIRN